MGAVPLVAFENDPIVEFFTDQVTLDSLVNIIKGRPISNVKVDSIVDLINDSGVRGFVMDSVASTELYYSEVRLDPNDNPD